MRCTQPPVAGTRLGAGWPLGPKPLGGRPLLCRRTGVGDVGGEKYSSLELDATATAGDIGDLLSGGGEAELSDGSGDGGRARREAALVSILLLLLPYFY